MPQGVLPLGQDLLPRQTMNNIDDEQYRGRPLPGGASDIGLTLRQGREKAYVFFGEEKSSPILLQIAPPVMLARLGVGFCFADTGRRPLT